VAAMVTIWSQIIVKAAIFQCVQANVQTFILVNIKRSVIFWENWPFLESWPTNRTWYVTERRITVIKVGVLRDSHDLFFNTV
jgi:hypothetical protein